MNPDTLYEGDCVELMQQLPIGSVDLIVTSPPYNLLNTSGGGVENMGDKGKWKKPLIAHGYDTYKDKMGTKQYIAWQRKFLRSCMRVLSPKGAIFYNHKWRVQNGLLQDRAEIVEGFPVRQIIIWQRAGGINFNDQYFLPTYEVIYLIAKKKFKLKDKANAVGDVWKIPQDANNSKHPAPFPVSLARRCIAATHAKLVLDPFMGSGTTAIAAEKEGRKWIGFEISHKYCKEARKRIEKSRTGFRFNRD